MKKVKQKVSIIVLCRNEGEGIERILKSIKNQADEIVVVDGHSNDGTKEISERLGANFYLDDKKGRGAALKIGIKKAKGDILVFFDADGSHEVKDIPKLIKPILEGKADLVIASRRTGGSYDQNINFTGIIRSAGCDFLVALVNQKYDTNLTDILYSFRAIKRTEALGLELKANDFRSEQEMVVKALENNLNIVEIPSREKARAWGKSKLRTIEGVRFLFSLVKELYL
jgi:glycosyltransferase involved in cell wall biosynthesis